MFTEDQLNDTNANKRIILLSDGIDFFPTDTKRYLSNLYDQHNPDVRNRVKIYTIALGSGADEAFLEEIANITHGVAYKAYTASELVDIYSEIGIGGDFDTTDTDGDGLYDAVEAAGIRLENGNIIYTDPTTKYTDKDDLEDGEEIDPIPLKSDKTVYNDDGTVKTVKGYYFVMNSDPRKKDTDEDGILDHDDPLKLTYGISNCMSNDYKEELFSEIDQIIKDDFSWIMENKNIGYYSTRDCIDILYEYDDLITDLSNEYLLPKAAIQTILLRELRCYDIRDDVADSLVIQQFVYRQMVEEYNDLEWWQQLLIGYPEMPIPYKEDSSVGYGQNFASTAINANNWGVNNSIINGKLYEYNNWKERQEVWDELREDNEYNISMIALVLIWGAYDKNLSNQYWSYNEDEIKSMLTRYNGTGDDAVKYGNDTYHCYDIFDKYNMLDVK